MSRRAPSTALGDLLGGAPITATVTVAAVAATLLFWKTPFGALLTMDDSFPERPWQLLTSTLCHADFLHILFNLMWLRSLLPVLEERLPPLLVTTLLVTLAAGSGAAEFAVGVGGVGLSGVVYGLLTFLWYASRHTESFAGHLPRSTVQYMVVWFFLCIVATRMNVMHIANTAHGVGGVLGWVAAWVVFSARETRVWKTLAYHGLVGLCLLAGSVGRQTLLSAVGEDELAAYSAYWSDFEALEALTADEDWPAAERLALRMLEEHGSGAREPLAHVYYLLGFSRMSQGKYLQAREDARRALAVDPTHLGARQLLDYVAGRLRD